MALFGPSAQSPLGLHPGKAERCRVKMRDSAGVKGNVVYFDAAGAATETVDIVAFGGATNPLSNVILATATHDGSLEATIWLLGILDEDIADDGEGWCTYRGVTQALITGTPAAGSALKPMADSELGLIIDKARACAITLETGVDATLGWVIFDGINQFHGSSDVA